MTGDAQAEAERIVDGLAEAVSDVIDGESKRAPELMDRRDEVVTALAAAIEVADDPYSGEGGWSRVQEHHRRMRQLRDTVSALRARAGEETG